MLKQQYLNRMIPALPTGYHGVLRKLPDNPCTPLSITRQLAY